MELKSTQKGILFHYLKERNSNLYNVQISLDLQGQLDVAALQKAFEFVQGKNEALRSVFFWEQSRKQLQIILKEHPIDFQIHDFIGRENTGQLVDKVSKEDRIDRFDLTKSLIRISLIRLANDSSVLNITYHHILFDGWSTSILIKEVFNAYEELCHGRTPSFVSKPSLKASRNAWKERTGQKRDKDFWKSYLKNSAKTSIISPVFSNIEGDDQSRKYTLSLSQEVLGQFARKNNVTPAAVFYAAFATLLKKIRGESEIMFGITVSGRDSEAINDDSIIDNFINTVPFKISLSDDKRLSEAATHVNELLVDINEHSASYHDIKDFLGVNYSEELFDTVVIIENYPIDDQVLDQERGWQLSLRSDYENPDIPLVIKVFLQDQLEIEFVYKTANISTEFVELLSGYLEQIIGSMNKGDLPLNQISLLEEVPTIPENIDGKDQTKSSSDMTIIDMFERQAATTPDSVAQICNDTNLTYHDLKHESDKTASYLENVGIKPGQLVAVILNREERLVPTILGIMKLGASFLPIDPSLPESRIKSILKDAKISFAITRNVVVQDSHENVTCLDLDDVKDKIEQQDVRPMNLPSENDDAYVIYTSGSTGTPKGVVIGHHSFSNYIQWAAGQYLIEDEFVMPVYTSISFDLTITSIFLPIISGGTIIVFTEGDQDALIKSVFHDSRVNTIKVTPSHLRLHKEQGSGTIGLNSQLKTLIVGGEQLETKLAKEIYKKYDHRLSIFNEYGPTEATVGCMTYQYNPEDTYPAVPIGVPINGTQIYLLDANLQPVPTGVSGQLYVSGAALSKGYLHRDQLTKSSFLDNPFLSSQKMYRTGDVALKRKDGELLFIGRDDYQVKLRGFRIELGEIEQILKRYSKQRKNGLKITGSVEKFNLDDDVQRCTRCLLTSNYPGISFNKEGVCNYCTDFDKNKGVIDNYFRDREELRQFFQTKEKTNEDYDCLLLYSGGKDSTYTLYRLLEMGLKVLTFTFDNGFISKIAFDNIQESSRKFNIKNLTRKSEHINRVLLESLRNKHNACTGCWNSINSLGVQVAEEYGIDTIVSGLSRGQIIEMRLEGLLEAGIYDEKEINDNLRIFRESFHSEDNKFFKLLNNNIDTEFLRNIQFVDYFRYDDVDTEGVKSYLKSQGWVQPKDTGLCSTNCVINDVGIYMHWKKKGYHFYEAPMSWDSRMNVIDRNKSLEELSDSFNTKKIDTILNKIGYYDELKIEEAIVTVNEDEQGNKMMLGYYQSPDEISDEELREHLQSTLPHYMMPNRFVHMVQFPLNQNGKIDRTKLPSPEMLDTSYVPPKTKEEKLLSKVWAEVLSMDKVGLTDNFFALGGDSIKSMQISSRMKLEGFELTVSDILKFGTIQSLVDKLKTVNTQADQSEVSGEVQLTPIQRWFFGESEKDQHHFNQSQLLIFPEGVSNPELSKVFNFLWKHHDALRMRFRVGKGQVTQLNGKVEEIIKIEDFDFTAHTDWEEQISITGDNIQSSFDLEVGPLIKVVRFQIGKETRVLIVIHHAVIDGVSWRILLEDLHTLLSQIRAGKSLQLPLKTDAFQKWSEALNQYLENPRFIQGKEYWKSFEMDLSINPKRDNTNGSGKLSSDHRISFSLSESKTRDLLSSANVAFNTRTNELILTALYLSYHQLYGHQKFLVDVESHGREDDRMGLDTTRTVGWFTNFYPVQFEGNSGNLTAAIKHVKEVLRTVPNGGLDSLLWKYTAKQSESGDIRPQILFNYLGQLAAPDGEQFFNLYPETIGTEISPNFERYHDWNISAIVMKNQFSMSLTFSKEQYNDETIQAYLNSVKNSLNTLIDFSCQAQPELTFSDLTYQGLSSEQLDFLQSRYDMEDVYPLTPMQQGILYHSILDEEPGNYFGQTTCQLKGDVDFKSVQESMERLVSRHAILRTVFLHKNYDEPIQVVLRQHDISFVFEDVREACTVTSKEQVVSEHLTSQKNLGFDWGNDIMMRLVMLQTADDEYELIWNHHHVLLDGWCMGIIVNEFVEIYFELINGKSITLPEVRPFSNYIAWLDVKDKAPAENYWKEYLSGYEELSTLPKRETYDAISTYKAGVYELTVPEQLMKSLLAVCGKSQATFNSLFELAWAVLLSKYNHSNEVVFGSVVSGRPAEIEGIESMVGLFVNTVPVRVIMDLDKTIQDHLRQIQEAAIESDPYQYHPLSDIQTYSDLGQNLFDHIITVENLPINKQVGVDNQLTPSHELPFEIRDINYSVQTNYDFNITVVPSNSALIRFDFNEYKFDHGFATELGVYLINIFEGIAKNPTDTLGNISLYGKKDLQQLKDTFSSHLEVPMEHPTIQAMLDKSFEKNRSNVAIEVNNRKVSYEEIKGNADLILSQLLSSDLSTGDKVGIYCQDRTWMICSMLGILKARMVFVPLEERLPQSRLSSMVKQAGVTHIIHDLDQIDPGYVNTDHSITFISVTDIIQTDLPQSFEVHADPEDPVYTYFTSGSTGEPKGIVGRNKGLAHFIQWEVNEFETDETFRFGQFTNPGFDVFLRDVFVPLVSGATICIPEHTVLSSGEGMSIWIEQQKITLLHCVPSIFRLIQEHSVGNRKLPDLKYVLLAGEKIIPGELKNWYDFYQEKVHLVNIYGPTETTLAKGSYLIKPEDARRKYLPIKSIQGSQFLVLDSSMEVCPHGAVGDLYIRTPYATAGYLNAALNQDLLVRNPFSNQPEAVLYRTGDLARRVDEAEVEILGRKDSQVKVRGIRIELSDIKENILAFEAASDAAVIVQKGSEKEAVIYAYVVLSEDGDLTNLQRFLSHRLPTYMLPSHLILIQKIPLLPNGKLDKLSLSKTESKAPEYYEPPTNDIELKLVEIWSELLELQREEIGVTHSFFELGGHSMKVLKLIGKINQCYGVEITLKDVIEKKQIRNLSDYIMTIKQTGEVMDPSDQMKEVVL